MAARFEKGKTYYGMERNIRVYVKVVATTINTVTFKLLGTQEEKSVFDAYRIDEAINARNQRRDIYHGARNEYSEIGAYIQDGWFGGKTYCPDIIIRSKYEVKLETAAKEVVNSENTDTATASVAKVTTSTKKLYKVFNVDEDDDISAKASDTKLNIANGDNRVDVFMTVANRKTIKGAYSVFTKALAQAVADGAISAKDAEFGEFADDVNDLPFDKNGDWSFEDNLDASYAGGIDDNDGEFYFWFFVKSEAGQEVVDTDTQETVDTAAQKVVEVKAGKFLVSVYNHSEHGNGMEMARVETAQQAAQFVIDFANQNFDKTVTDFYIKKFGKGHGEYRSTDADLAAIDALIDPAGKHIYEQYKEMRAWISDYIDKCDCTEEQAEKVYVTICAGECDISRAFEATDETYTAIVETQAAQELTANMKLAAQIVDSLGEGEVKFSHAGAGKNGGLALHYDLDDGSEFGTGISLVEVFTDKDGYILDHVNVIKLNPEKTVTTYNFNQLVDPAPTDEPAGTNDEDAESAPAKMTISASVSPKGALSFKKDGKAVAAKTLLETISDTYRLGYGQSSAVMKAACYFGTLNVGTDKVQPPKSSDTFWTFFRSRVDRNYPKAAAFLDDVRDFDREYNAGVYDDDKRIRREKWFGAPAHDDTPDTTPKIDDKEVADEHEAFLQRVEKIIEDCYNTKGWGNTVYHWYNPVEDDGSNDDDDEPSVFNLLPAVDSLRDVEPTVEDLLPELGALEDKAAVVNDKYLRVTFAILVCDRFYLNEARRVLFPIRDKFLAEANALDGEARNLFSVFKAVATADEFEGHLSTFQTTFNVIHAATGYKTREQAEEVITTIGDKLGDKVLADGLTKLADEFKISRALLLKSDDCEFNPALFTTEPAHATEDEVAALFQTESDEAAEPAPVKISEPLVSTEDDFIAELAARKAAYETAQANTVKATEAVIAAMRALQEAEEAEQKAKVFERHMWAEYVVFGERKARELRDKFITNDVINAKVGDKSLSQLWIEFWDGKFKVSNDWEELAQYDTPTQVETFLQSLSPDIAPPNKEPDEPQAIADELNAFYAAHVANTHYKITAINPRYGKNQPAAFWKIIYNRTEKRFFITSASAYSPYGVDEICAGYDTLEQVRSVVEMLRAAIDRGDKQFIFPTVDALTEQNSCKIEKDDSEDDAATFKVGEIYQADYRKPDDAYKILSRTAKFVTAVPVAFEDWGETTADNGYVFKTKVNSDERGEFFNYEDAKVSAGETYKLDEPASTEESDKQVDTPEHATITDSLARAMKIALLKVQEHCLKHDMKAAQREMALYTICAEAMREDLAKPIISPETKK